MTEEWPNGFSYQPEFISEVDERELVERVRQLQFSEVKLRGVVARRHVAHFGWNYDYDSRMIEPGPAMPEFLLPLQARVGALIGSEPDRFGEALVTEYPAGSGIGWHRDAPAFGQVIAVSLAGPCRLRLRQGKDRKRALVSVVVEPRSAYVLDQAARWRWQHSIAPTKTPRYSITFRTLLSEPF